LRETADIVEKNCLYPADRNHLAHLTLELLQRRHLPVKPGRGWKDLEDSAALMPGSPETVRADLLNALLVSIGDPYARFSPPPERGGSNDGAFAGIGVEVAWKVGRLTVVGTLEGSPACAQGLQRDDVIQAINGRQIEQM